VGAGVVILFPVRFQSFDFKWISLCIDIQYIYIQDIYNIYIFWQYILSVLT
jgi:hypothetical protein